MFEEVSEYFLEVLQGVNLGHVFRCIGRGRARPRPGPSCRPRRCPDRRRTLRRFAAPGASSPSFRPVETKTLCSGLVAREMTVQEASKYLWELSFTLSTSKERRSPQR